MIRMALDLFIRARPAADGARRIHGLNTLHYQPAKLAAIEGLYDTAQPAPLTLFGIPDDGRGTMHDAVEIPKIGSLDLAHSWNGEIKGLKEWPADDRPPVADPFFAFRIMVAIAVIMLFVVITGQFMRRGGRVYQSAWFLRLCQWTCAARLRRRDRRLDDNRGRAPALDGLRADAHRQFGVARR